MEKTGAPSGPAGSAAGLELLVDGKLAAVVGNPPLHSHENRAYVSAADPANAAGATVAGDAELQAVHLDR